MYVYCIYTRISRVQFLYYILYCIVIHLIIRIYVNLNTHILYNKFDRLYTQIQNLKSDTDNIINY
jgi:hypothetical protein